MYLWLPDGFGVNSVRHTASRGRNFLFRKMITCLAALSEKLALGWQVKRLHIDCHSQCLNSVFWSAAPLGLRRDLYKHSATNCKTDVSISFYVGANCGTLCLYSEAFFYPNGNDTGNHTCQLQDGKKHHGTPPVSGIANLFFFWWSVLKMFILQKH